MTSLAGRLRALSEAATPGPWCQTPETAAGRVWVQRAPNSAFDLHDCQPLFNVRDSRGYKQREDDARLIVFARNVWPQLVAVVEEADKACTPRSVVCPVCQALAALARAIEEAE